jgi:hypothetical protein
MAITCDQSTLDWLSNQNDAEAQCALLIIKNKTLNGMRYHVSDVLCWLAKKAETAKAAGQAYLLVEQKYSK